MRNVWGGLFSIVPCHRRPDRSFRVNGKPMPLCARCTAVLLGYLVTPIAVILGLTVPYYVVGLLLVPMLLDGFTQLWKLRESTNLLRFLTGILFGVGQSLFISNLAWLLVGLLEG